MSPTLQAKRVDTHAGSGASPGIWAEVVSHTDSKYGGLSSAVPALSASLAYSSHVSTRLEAFCLPGEETVPESVDAHEIHFWPAGRRAWMSADLRTRFKDALRGVAGVHIHGLWESSTAVAASTCRALNLPYVLSAHGMLEPWALRSSQWKKQLYSLLVERRNVGGAACLHALTGHEADQFRAFGARGPIAVIPNGVTIPAGRDSALFFQRFPDLLGKRVILFLARLHPKKGLDLLLQAWPAIAACWPEAHLVLAGPDCEGTQARLESLIAAQQLQRSITFTGMLRGAEKWSALNAAECFILPSHSEGLSVSVLEALGVGCPVIVTEACNMPEVLENKAGWQVTASSAAISDALHEVMRNSVEQNRAMGLRGAELIQRRYTWPVVAAQMAEVYAFVHGAAQPATVSILQL
jgi:glycosyltransferase involved in cell wall biosynthesis